MEEEDKHFISLFVLILIVISFSLFVFIKYVNDKFISWDGFVYLTYSYSIIKEKLFLDRIRSPLLVLVIPPNLEIARIFMVFFHLGTAIFVFKILYKLTKDNLISLCGGILYGINPYMLDFTRFVLSDLPAVFFFILSLFFFFNEDRKSKIISGVFSGFSFSFRPDVGVLILIIFFLNMKDKKNWKYFLTTFLFVGVFLNFFSAFLVFKKPIYPPLEFIKVNFLEEKMAFNTQTTRYENYFWFISNFLRNNLIAIPFFLLSIFSLRNKYYLQFLSMFIIFSILSVFLPKISDRIYVTKITPIFSILVTLSFSFYKKRLKLLLSIVLICFAFVSTIKLISWFKYPVWTPEDVEYKKNGIICSNQPFVYIYLNKVQASLIFVDKNINFLKNQIKRCNYTYIFIHPEINFLRNEDIKALSDEYNVKLHRTGDYFVYEISLKNFNS